MSKERVILKVTEEEFKRLKPFFDNTPEEGWMWGGVKVVIDKKMPKARNNEEEEEQQELDDFFNKIAKKKEEKWRKEEKPPEFLLVDEKKKKKIKKILSKNGFSGNRFLGMEIVTEKNLLNIKQK